MAVPPDRFRQAYSKPADRARASFDGMGPAWRQPMLRCHSRESWNPVLRSIAGVTGSPGQPGRWQATMRVGSRIPNLLQAQFKRARWIRLAQTMLKGFISYAHADSDLCEMFIKQVNMLKHSRIAAFWADHGIEAGDPWEEVILVRM